MTYDQVLQELKNKKYHPVYLLHGPESYFIDQLADHLEHQVLSESEKAFNLTIFYGKDTDHMAVTDVARRYPMMSPYQVILIKEAQDMKSLDKLEGYINNPVATSILVICHKHKNLSMATKLGKLLQKKALVFESKKLYDNQVPDWIRQYLQGRQLKIADKVAVLIAEYLGTELSKITNELDKLCLNLPPGTQTVTEAHVEANIGISKEFNIFELQSALGEKNVLKANRIIQYFASNPKKNPPQVVIVSLYGFFSKIYQYHAAKNLPEKELLSTLQLRSAYFLKDYIAAARHFPPTKAESVIALLKEYDLKSKGVGYNSTGKEEGDLMKELVWKILH